MLKPDLLSGPSCLTDAYDDEPLFLLRANDPEAPMLVRDWAHRYWETKIRGGKEGDPVVERRLDKMTEAFRCADEMSNWKRQNPDGKRAPIQALNEAAPAEPIPSNGHTMIFDKIVHYLEANAKMSQVVLSPQEAVIVTREIRRMRRALVHKNTAIQDAIRYCETSGLPATYPTLIVTLENGLKE